MFRRFRCRATSYGRRALRIAICVMRIRVQGCASFSVRRYSFLKEKRKQLWGMPLSQRRGLGKVVFSEPHVFRRTLYVFGIHLRKVPQNESKSKQRRSSGSRSCLMRRYFCVVPSAFKLIRGILEVGHSLCLEEIWKDLTPISFHSRGCDGNKISVNGMLPGFGSVFQIPGTLCVMLVRSERYGRWIG